MMNLEIDIRKLDGLRCLYLITSDAVYQQEASFYDIHYTDC